MKEPTVRTRKSGGELTPAYATNVGTVSNEPLSEAPAEFVPGGIKIRWKFILTVITAVLGGGTIAGLGVTVGTKDTVSTEFNQFKSEQDDVHAHITETLKKQDERSVSQDLKIETISGVITAVQTTQQRDVARNEARRLTEKISNREEREFAYDRLYELNLKHLSRGEDPCGSLSCQ